ncbi:MAG: hypothetical protein WC729_01605 [Sphingomonas sp.]|uniref:hypothetical protein n=1 Tax=Sphingomonas sp. TaxID=28214 RepID=UPI00356674E4
MSDATGEGASRTIVVLIHGIGFAKVGDLAPALDMLKLAQNQVSIDANWNVIAAADYSDTLSFDQLSKLFRSIDGTARLRPQWEGKRPSLWINLIEFVIDICDLFSTLVLWLVPIIAFIGLFYSFSEAKWDLGLLHMTRAYISLYFTILAGAAVLVILSLIMRVGVGTLSRAMHLLIVFLRPIIVVFYLYMALINRRAHDNPISAILAAFYLVGGACFLIALILPSHTWRLEVMGLLILAFLLAPLIVSRFLAPGLKLMLDVLLYISDARYRNSILDALDAHVTSAEPDRETATLVIIGHSLGSVIAADFLMDRVSPGRFSAVTLVTAGSPISRLFQRIFPDHLIPGTVGEIIRHASERAAFRWLNYYRKYDGVGARLDLPPMATCIESVSPYISDPLRSHIGYWTEPQFHAFVRSNWRAGESADGQ